MSEVRLSEPDQAALRFVVAAEPLAGRALPTADVLKRLARLVPCDAIGAAVIDHSGHVLDQMELPTGHGAPRDTSVCDGPLRMGVVHRTRVPGYAEHLRRAGLSDSVAIGLRNRRDCVVQLWWDRRTGEFSARDIAVVTIVAPAVQRLVRDAGPTSLPKSLTMQERRTLVLVAAGFSNGEIAQRMGVATCTVRKHLEHAYRKLGVTNRLAAVVALRGEMFPTSYLATSSQGPAEAQVAMSGAN